MPQITRRVVARPEGSPGSRRCCPCLNLPVNSEAALVVGEEKAVAEAKRWNRIGYAVLAGTFGVAVLWSSLAPLSSAVVAQGRSGGQQPQEDPAP